MEKAVFNAEAIRRLARRPSVWLPPAIVLGVAIWRLRPDLSVNWYSPDSILYVTLARAFIDSLDLSIAGYGHVDIGIILPPAYPVLVAIFGWSSPNLLGVAEDLSSASFLVLLLAVFLLLRKQAGPWVAATVAISLPFFSQMELMARSPLTEMVFLTGVSLGVLATLKACRRAQRLRLLFLAGVLVGSIFLVRQIGAVVAVYLIAWVALTLIRRVDHRRRAATALGVYLLGVILLPGAYSVALWQQTGQLPLTQTYRLGVYEVEGDPGDAKASLGEAATYHELAAERRRRRRLSTDGREMIEYLVASEGVGAAGRFQGRTLARSLENFSGNLASFAKHFGWPLLVLFGIALLAPLFVRDPETDRTERWLLGGLVLTYGVVISIFTDLVPRYMLVVLPWVLIQVAQEAVVVVDRVAKKVPVHWRSGFGLAVVAGILVLSGSVEGSLELQKRLPGDFWGNSPFREIVPAEAPIFSLHPKHAFYAGGKFRVLPNDALERVAAYGGLTGATWLLLPEPVPPGDQTLHAFAPWLRFRRLDAVHPRLVTGHVYDPITGLALYRLKVPASPQGP